jgi:malonate transporter and related proteins
VIRALATASPNTAFMGIPVIMVLFGSKGMLSVIISSVILSLVVCVAVVMLEVFLEPKNLSLFKLIKKIIVKNPIILSILAGFLLSALNIELPKSIAELFSQLGSTCGPCAMFAIGMTLTLKLPRRIIPQLVIINLARLIVMPAIVFLLLLLFNASPLMAATGLILSAMPVAATTFIIAQQYETDVHESSDMVISSTLISIITLSIAILIISSYFPSIFIS